LALFRFFETLSFEFSDFLHAFGFFDLTMVVETTLTFRAPQTEHVFRRLPLKTVHLLQFQPFFSGSINESLDGSTVFLSSSPATSVALSVQTFTAEVLAAPCGPLFRVMA
jgi:hypothetical protein